MFIKEKVSELAVILDKVKVSHISHTVILIFFFYNGHIFCYLNKLVTVQTATMPAALPTWW